MGGHHGRAIETAHDDTPKKSHALSKASLKRAAGSRVACFRQFNFMKRGFSLRDQTKPLLSVRHFTIGIKYELRSSRRFRRTGTLLARIPDRLRQHGAEFGLGEFPRLSRMPRDAFPRHRADKFRQLDARARTLWGGGLSFSNLLS
jgi:hypothetical protein